MEDDYEEDWEPSPELWRLVEQRNKGSKITSSKEVEIPSLRILMETKLEEAEWVQARYNQLNLIDEKRLAAICHGQLYQNRMKKAFDKKSSSARVA